MSRFVSFVGVIVFVIIGAKSASAQTFVEHQILFASKTTVPQVDAQLEIGGKKVNAYGWFLVSENWGEALLGVSKSIKPWLWVAVAAGVETDDDPWRASPAVWMGKGRVSFFFVTEHGGSGFWYKTTGLVRIIDHVEVGVHVQRFYGVGPMLKLSLPNKFAIWSSFAPTEGRAILGFNKVF